MKQILADKAKRPQDNFIDVDNSRNKFIPKLKSKPNSIIELPTSNNSKESLSLNSSIFSSSTSKNKYIGINNPYETEIRQAAMSPPSWLLKEKTNIPMFKKLHEVKYEYIDNIKGLEDMIDSLEKELAIAVDLENHSMRSFQGFVCLMQISTHTSDYIIDTILLRNHLHVLNTIFTNPNIVKVFHGADYDIHWLQRDFGIYVVSLYDTGQNSRVLEYPSFSITCYENSLWSESK